MVAVLALYCNLQLKASKFSVICWCFCFSVLVAFVGKVNLSSLTRQGLKPEMRNQMYRNLFKV